jgi:hypothetical protein
MRALISENVGNSVKEWKRVQEARAVEMPVALRLMAKRLAEEAWVLALIARQIAQPEAGPSAPPPEPPAESQVRPAPPKQRSAPPKRGDGAGEGRARPAVSEVWVGAKVPKFAKAVAEALREAGHPLYTTSVRPTLRAVAVHWRAMDTAAITGAIGCRLSTGCSVRARGCRLRLRSLTAIRPTRRR